jgi:hypothetical protein
MLLSAIHRFLSNSPLPRCPSEDYDTIRRGSLNSSGSDRLVELDCTPKLRKEMCNPRLSHEVNTFLLFKYNSPVNGAFQTACFMV